MSNDSWCTPDWLFKELNDEFNFDIDLCATKENSKCTHYYEDYLNNKLASKARKIIKDRSIKEIVDISQISAAFCNPPYSNPKPFIEKAWEDSKYCKIVCLVKVDPSTRWWATFWDYDKKCPYCDDGSYKSPYSSLGDNENSKCFKCKGTQKISGPKPGCEVRFFPKRVKFDPPKELIDSGDVWKVGNKWVKKCCSVKVYGLEKTNSAENFIRAICQKCKGKGYKEFSGPTFPVCLVIMDRRNV